MSEFESDIPVVVDDDIAVSNLDPSLFWSVEEPEIEPSVLAFQLSKARREACNRFNLRQSASKFLDHVAQFGDLHSEGHIALTDFVNAVVVCLTDGSDERSDGSIVFHESSSSIGDGCGDCQPIEEDAEIIGE